jgi:hypothetical protein
MPQTLYPRGTVKKIVKAHANRPLSKNVDILVFLKYALFMQEYVFPSSEASPPGPGKRTGGDVKLVCDGN